MCNDMFEINKLIELSVDDSQVVNGGGIGGVVVYGLNGACIGLATALVCGVTNDDWTGADTVNCIKTGAVTGACIGLVFPL